MAPLYAQQVPLQLSFFRQNNFTYSTQLTLQHTWGKDRYRAELRLRHDNIYNSSREQNPFIQFYLNTNFWQYLRLTDELELVSWLEADQFFNAASHRLSLYLGASYKWKEYLELTPMLGYSLDYRSMSPDRGISPALKVVARYQWPDGLVMQTQGFARWKNIAPRQQRNVVLATQWARSFGEFAQLNLGLQLGSHEFDDYTASTPEGIRADSFAVERIISDTLAPFLSLRYRLLPQLDWDADTRLVFSRRRLNYELQGLENQRLNDLSFDQLDIQTRQRLSFTHKNLSAYLLYEYQYFTRRYELENTQGLARRPFEQLRTREKQKDYFRNLNVWELNLTYRLSPRHSWNLSANNRYLQFDTPSEDNFDDHDQLNYGLATEWRAAWSSKFSTRYKILGNVRRYAFLLKERSQDNYTQRSLRMEFRYRWLPLDRLTVKGEQFIYVTYNVKDFEDLNRTDRSTRNIESRLKASYRLNSKWDFEWDAYRKETHVSYLDWQNFSETTLDTTRTYVIEQTTQRQLKQWKNQILFLDLGYKHFSLTRLFNTSMTSLENVLTPINLRSRNIQTGVRTGIRWEQRYPASINLSVWWQVQYQDFRFKEIGSFTSLSANYREEVLREVQVNFRPFIKFQMNIYLNR